VTVQARQPLLPTNIQTPDPRQLEDAHEQNQSNPNFQHYLEEEQKRLLSFFSPFNQLDFSSWFSYAPSATNSGSSKTSDLLSNLAAYKQPDSHQTELAQSNGTNHQASSVMAQVFGQDGQVRSVQSQLQEILVNTGWLIPNLEALPMFNQAELDGKLAQIYDLQLLIDQILSQIDLVKEKGKTELRLGLKPDNLGEIMLSLTSHSGLISIVIEASEKTKKIIESSLTDLEAALKKALVNFNEIKIVATKEVGNNA